MKIIHGSLSGLLAEVSTHGEEDEVRVGALMQNTIDGARIPYYTGWVIVSAHVAGEQWAEWRFAVGRQRAEISEHGLSVPDKLIARTEDKLAEVRGWIDAAGLRGREGILAADAETLEGILA